MKHWIVIAIATFVTCAAPAVQAQAQQQAGKVETQAAAPAPSKKSFKVSEPEAAAVCMSFPDKCNEAPLAIEASVVNVIKDSMMTILTFTPISKKIDRAAVVHAVCICDLPVTKGERLTVLGRVSTEAKEILSTDGVGMWTLAVVRGDEILWVNADEMQTIAAWKAGMF